MPLFFCAKEENEWAGADGFIAECTKILANFAPEGTYLTKCTKSTLAFVRFDINCSQIVI